MPASSCPFVLAIASQKKRDFIEVYGDIFAFLGGVSEILVPVNLKSTVIKADNYEPGVSLEIEQSLVRTRSICINIILSKAKNLHPITIRSLQIFFFSNPYKMKEINIEKLKRTSSVNLLEF